MSQGRQVSQAQQVVLALQAAQEEVLALAQEQARVLGLAAAQVQELVRAQQVALEWDLQGAVSQTVQEHSLVLEQLAQVEARERAQALAQAEELVEVLEPTQAEE